MAGKKIKGITIEIDGNATGLDKALKGVNSTSVKLNSELGQVNKLLKFDPSNVTGLSQKQELLTKSIENTSDKLNQLKSAQSQVEAQYKSGNIGEEQYRAFQREIATTEQSLKGYKSQLSNLQSEQQKLGQNTDRLNTYFSASGKSIDDFSGVLGTKLVNSIKNGTASSDQLELALNKIAKEALGAEGDVSKFKNALDKVDDGGSINSVKASLEELKVTSNSTDEELSKIGGGITSGNMMQAAQVLSDAGEKVNEFAKNAQDAFREIDDGMDTFATTTGKNSDVIKASFDAIYTSMPIESTADLGQALGSLNQQFGFTGDKLTGYGTQLMQFAEINNVDVKSSVDNAKSAIETYGLSYDDLGSVLDTATAVSQKTGVGVDDLMTKVVEGAPQIKALGLSFGEGTEMLGKFEQAGVDSSDALSSLSKANVVYAKDGKTLQEGLKGTIDSIKGAKSQTEALTIASEVFGTKGATRMVDGIKRGKFNFDELGGAAEKSAGTVKNTFDSTVDPIDKQAVALQSAKVSFAEIGATIAESLLPILDKMVPIFKQIAEAFDGLSPSIKQFIIVFGGMLIILSILAPIIAAIMAVGSTVALIAVGIGVAIAAIILIFQNWGAIVEWLKGVWSSISPFFSSIFGFLASIFSGFQPVLDVFVSFFQNTVTNVMTIFNGIVSVLQGIFNIVIGIFTLNGEQIGQGFAQVFQGLIGIVSGVFSQIINFVTSSLGAIVNLFSGILGGIIGIVSGIFNSVKDAFINPLETAKGAIKGIVDAIKGFFSFSITWPKIPMPHFSINPAGWEAGDLLKGKIPSLGIDWFANGGILTKPTIFGQNGNSLMVGGEAGKEAVAPLSDLMAYVEAAVANQIGDMSGNFAQMIQLLSIIANKDLALDFPGGDLARISYKETEKLMLRRNI